jgi:hypothetical protein
VVGDLGERRLVGRAHQRDAARPEESGQPFTGDVVGHDYILLDIYAGEVSRAVTPA